MNMGLMLWEELGANLQMSISASPSWMHAPHSSEEDQRYLDYFFCRLLGQLRLDLSDLFRFHIPALGEFIADQKMHRVPGLFDQID